MVELAATIFVISVAGVVGFYVLALWFWLLTALGSLLVNVMVFVLAGLFSLVVIYPLTRLFRLVPRGD